MIRSRRLNRRLALLLSALMLSPSSALANPLGGQVVGGQAAIQGQGTNSVTITQGTNSAIINWNTFNIGAGERTQFIQPSATSIALNRVIGGLGPSQLLGGLTANGQIFLVNPNGVLIGQGAVINAAGFLATTHDISNADFMAGRYNFNIPGRPDASIVNLGTISITPSSSGFAALVAPGVRNAGVITADLGRVALASGNGFTLDFYGDKLITLQVNDQIANQVIDVATNQPLKSLVSNEGRLRANGGQVALTAVAARTIVDSVINNSGVIEANSVGTRNGMIVLGAATAATKGAGAPTQKVKISGTLSAKGSNKGEKGGTINVTGESIELANAKLDASGDAGGGTVSIGGKNVDPSSMVTIDNSSIINASATGQGDGGNVVLWSNGLTSVTGTILATGGALGGNGGLVETSGQTVYFNGIHVDTSAPNGQTGMWLIDPTNLIVDSEDALTILNGLKTTSITLQTNANGSTSGPGDTSSGNGDIDINAPITWATNSSLTLNAFHDININASITSTGGGAVTLRADNTGTGAGTVSFGTSSQHNDDEDCRGCFNSPGLISTSGAVSIFYNPTSYASTDSSSVQGGNPFSHNVTGGAHLTAYMLVNTATDLQHVGTNLDGIYALGRNIDASNVSFKPIGSVPGQTFEKQFTGIFDGQYVNGVGPTISNLNITPINGNVNSTGLFAINAGTIRNLNLSNVSVTANVGLPGQLLGTLAAQNLGTISNVWASGTVNGGQNVGTVVGGLVGQNSTLGQITNAHANVTVTIGDSCSGNCNGIGSNSAGGLVGTNLGTIDQSSANGSATIGSFGVAGGLVAFNLGSISNSQASGGITSAGVNVTLGGLVGLNTNDVESSQASGNVTATAASSSSSNCSSSSCIGGLVGQNFGTINQSSADGNVTVGSFGMAGGLVGLNLSQITNSSAAGDVTVGSNAYGGGLAGTNNGTVSGSDATGDVTAGNSSFAGGLVGWNVGTIGNSFADGGAFVQMVHVGSQGTAGGLVGLNDVNGSISASYATANVTGDAGASSDNVTVLGGLVGQNQGSLSGAHATVVVGSLGIDFLGVGGLVGKNNGTISASDATGNVMAGNSSFAGGLVGLNLSQITNSSAGGNVTVGSNAYGGGLAGKNNGTVSGSDASGNVTAGNSSFAGGLVGWNVGTIGNSFADGGAFVQTVHVGSQGTAGGLVGLNDVNGSISASYATANVTGDAGASSDNVTVLGGLVGQNQGSLSGAHATVVVGSLGIDFLGVGGLVGKNNGTVSGSDAAGNVMAGNSSFAGGLAGLNLSQITNSSAAGDVTVGSNAFGGGLVGKNNGTISGSDATGNVMAGNSSFAGGLVGWNVGTIGNSFADGGASVQTVHVGSQGVAGGLVGLNDVSGSISASHATASVTGDAGASSTNVTVLGGLVGQNEGSLSGAHATVTVGSLGIDFLGVGGLVGTNNGTISGSDATGNVMAGNFSFAGGLVGKNNGGTISGSDASGNVTAGNSSFAGGLVGWNVGTIANADDSAFVQTVHVGSQGTAGGLVGLNDVNGSISASSAAANVTGDAGASSTNVTVLGGLVGQNQGSVSGSHATGPVGALGTDFLGVGGLAGTNNGTVSGSDATGNVMAGNFSFAGGLVGKNNNGGTVSDSDASGNVTAGNSGFAGGLVAWNVGTISNSFANGGAFVQTVHVGSQGTAGGLVGFNDVSGSISASSAAANVTGDAGASSTNVTVLGGLVGQNQGSVSGSHATGPVGALGIDFLQVGGLAGTNNGTISGSDAIGNVTAGNSSFAGGLAGKNNGTVSGSDASGNVTAGNFSFVGGLVGWNVGTISNSFAFVQAVHVGSQGTAGGLVGFNDVNGSISASSAAANVTGDAGASSTNITVLGGLVGQNQGSVDGSHATGTVGALGIDFLGVGGLAGTNNGTVSGSDASGNVMAGNLSFAGGLVGWNVGTIANADDSAFVQTVHVGSQGLAGGLVGFNGVKGSISASVAAANVTGDAGASSDNLTVLGGLVGQNQGTVSGSHATGTVGTLGIDFLGVGGLAGRNDGTVSGSDASGNVMAGNFSFAGGLVAINQGTLDQTKVGSAGSANNTVIGGNNSILGGLVAVNDLNAMVTNSSVFGSVTSTGPNSVIGGFVGVSGGNIENSQTAAAVTGTSKSYVGGFIGINVGTVVDSQVVDPASVTVTGSGNVVGGFVGMNIGSIDPSTTSVTPHTQPGTNNIVGGFAGANFNFANVNFGGLQLPDPTFPTGTISHDSTTIDTVHPFIGTDLVTSGPSAPPAPPSIVHQCSDPLCAIIVALPLGDNTTTNNSLPNTPPPIWQQIALFTPDNQPTSINLTTGGSGGAGGNGGNAGGANGNRSPGPPPGAGLDRTLSEQQFSGVPPIGETRFQPGEIVMQISDTVPLADVQKLAAQFGITLVSSQNIPGRVLYRFRFASNKDIRRLIVALEHNNLVASVQPNYVFGLSQGAPAPAAPATPQDQSPPPAGDTTGSIPPPAEAAPDLANSNTASLESLPVGDAAQYVIGKLHLGDVHRLARGRNVSVAVIDSEIDARHPDLAGVLMERYDATQSPSHPHAHGTGMAGAIASHSRLLGVAPGVRLLAIKAFDEAASSAEATSFQILKGLDYAIAKNVRIINMSFAGPRDPMMERTLKTAHDKGIILIAAAGNAGPKSPPLYPGADPSVIAVTATDYTDKPFSMANRGKYVAIAAPGVDVMVPAPGNTYQLTTGTSVAAAHVSGVAALLVERKPTITPDEVRAVLMRTARAFAALPKGELDGAGLIDPVGALQALALGRSSEASPPAHSATAH